MSDCLAERQGFEPWVPEGTTVFETAPIGHSGTFPKKHRQRYEKNVKNKTHSRQRPIAEYITCSEKYRGQKSPLQQSAARLLHKIDLTRCQTPEDSEINWTSPIWCKIQNSHFFQLKIPIFFNWASRFDLH